MRVLAVDTTTARGSVAVVEGGCVVGEVRLRSEASHSRRLLPAVAFLLESLDLGPESLEGYVAANGPGSFTGLRIGLSTVQGLAVGHPAPCVGICTLDALAFRIRGTARRLVALMDAYRGEVYAGVYDEQARPLEGPLVLPLEKLLERLEVAQAAFLGDAVAACRDRIVEALPGACFPDRELFLAGTLGLMGERRLLDGDGVAPASLRPAYVREADAVQARRGR